MDLDGPWVERGVECVVGTERRRDQSSIRRAMRPRLARRCVRSAPAVPSLPRSAPPSASPSTRPAAPVPATPRPCLTSLRAASCSTRTTESARAAARYCEIQIECERHGVWPRCITHNIGISSERCGIVFVAGVGIGALASFSASFVCLFTAALNSS